MNSNYIQIGERYHNLNSFQQCNPSVFLNRLPNEHEKQKQKKKCSDVNETQSTDINQFSVGKNSIKKIINYNNNREKRSIFSGQKRAEN